ncbi:MAG TPA: ABC transporter permease [Blastocatellia bacterium]|nr:ABC transporter permease [Blastocatellia bacterium]
MLRKLYHRLRAQIRLGKVEREMDAEMRFHLEMETAQNIRRGMSEEEARRVALLSFGGVEQVKEEYRDLSRFRWIEDLWQDVRFNLRLLRKQPGFLAVAALTLALGIGASTAVFTVVNGVLIRSLPFRDASRLVLLNKAYISLENPYSKQSEFNQSAFAWKDQVKSFEQIAAFGMYDGGVNLTGVGEAERIEARDVSANFFETLGVSAVTGRVFGPDQEKAENQAVAVISHALWRRRFAGALNAIGQPLRLNGKSFTIIGVAPPELQYPAKLDVWIPISSDLESRVFTSPIIGHAVFARLKPGVTLAEARAEMKAFSDRTKLNQPIGVTPLAENMTGKIRQSLLLLMTAVGFVLLIACANVANLLLARSATRRRELAVRSAIGAGRRRLIRQSLTESLLIGVLGGFAGLLLAVWLQNLLLAFSPPDIPRLDEITLDYRVLAFNAALALLTGTLVGLLPAVQGSKFDLIDSLKDDVQKSGAGTGGLRLKSALIVGEIAVSLVLLIGAGLLLRSLTKVLSVEAGFEREQILTVSMALPHGQYSGRASALDFYDRLMEQIRTIPEVVAVGASNKVPLSREDVFASLFEIEGRPQAVNDNGSFATLLSVSSDYFNALGISVLEGRTFNEADRQHAPPVLIINETMARRVFPERDALGKRVKLPVESVPREIIGVVRDVRSFKLEDEPQKEMFLPLRQGGNSPATLAIRTVGDPALVAPAVRDAIRRLDENLPPYDIKTIGQRISESLARRKFLVSLISLFALLALALAATGIYGVMSFLVTERTREIGIRLALGATEGDALRLILKQGLVQIVAGTAFGLIGALALTRLIQAFLFEVSAIDTLVFFCAAILLALTALVAAYIPGRRAMKVDPLVAIRHE